MMIYIRRKAISETVTPMRSRPGSITRTKSAGVSPVLSSVILAAVTLAVGLLLVSLATSWFAVNALDTTQQTDKGIALVRTSGLLTFELVRYTSREDLRLVVLRNIAPQDLCITRIELIRQDGSLGGAWPSSPGRWVACGPDGLAPIAPQQKAELTSAELPECPSCFFGERTKLRIWYIARTLYNSDQPELSADEMKFVETIIVYPGARIGSPCALPEGTRWTTITAVDPMTNFLTGAFSNPPNNRFSVLINYANPLTLSPQTFKFGLEDGDSSLSLTTDLRVGVTYEQHVGGVTGIETPFNLVIEGDSYIPIPSNFRFGALRDRSVHVSGIGLITQYIAYISDQPVVTAIQVEVGKHDNPATFQLTVVLRDCVGELLARLTRTVSLSAGVQWETTYLDLPAPLDITDVYYVEVELS
jgi:hypothetical protein